MGFFLGPLPLDFVFDFRICCLPNSNSIENSATPVRLWEHLKQQQKLFSVTPLKNPWSMFPYPGYAGWNIRWAGNLNMVIYQTWQGGRGGQGLWRKVWDLDPSPRPAVVPQAGVAATSSCWKDHTLDISPPTKVSRAATLQALESLLQCNLKWLHLPCIVCQSFV